MLETWRCYNQYIESPETYIDFGFYSLVSGCLGRKVWIGDYSNKLHLNTFTVFVGPPGVGKSRITDRVRDLLYRVSKDGQIQDGEFERFPSPEILAVKVLPDKLTCPWLITGLSKLGTSSDLPNGKILIHASAMICLSDMDSLFRGYEVSQTVGLITQLYDCQPYSSGTDKRGGEGILNGCLAILAGTNPTFMARCHEENILKEGFAARAWFVCESLPRFRLFDSNRNTEETIRAKRKLLEFILELSKLVGPIKFSEESFNALRGWYEKDFGREIHNRSPYLVDYNERKKVHVQKLAALLYLSENPTLSAEIPLPYVSRAFNELKRIEANMHTAFNYTPRGRSITGAELVNILGNKSLNLEELYQLLNDGVSIKDYINSIREASKKGLIKLVNVNNELQLCKPAMSMNKRFNTSQAAMLLENFERTV